MQLIRMIKSTPYQAFVNAYPHKIEQLRLLLEKERQLFTNVRFPTFVLFRFEATSHLCTS
jgi:hypothetical protein